MIPNVIGGLVELFSKKKETDQQLPNVYVPLHWLFKGMCPFEDNGHPDEPITEDIPHEVVGGETKLLTDDQSK